MSAPSPASFEKEHVLAPPTRTLAYLKTLPQGIESFPGCDTTVSLCSHLRRAHPAIFAHPLLPESFRAHLSAPWRDGDFLPITIQVAVMMLLTDCLGLDAASLSDLVCRETQEVFDKPAYRVFFRLVSPAMVVMGGKIRWNRDFRGIPMTLKMTSSVEASGTLNYPPGLTTPQYLAALGGIFRAALEKSRGVGIRCQIEEKEPGRATFLLNWT